MLHEKPFGQKTALEAADYLRQLSNSELVSIATLLRRISRSVVDVIDTNAGTKVYKCKQIIVFDDELAPIESLVH